ncbi:MAG: peptide-methionine (S)-S-oxide reductase MsrA, partial [Candidatus Nanopelagicales bacterium]|nr:peptide-methionine (S)-S-oxide reductase MsrA [Candidatus Nanopelagicales bacterium]
WLTPGVTATSVGYMGGLYPSPSYEEVCTGRTGHAETARVDYDPTVIPSLEILRIFWEQHDPTQGMRQGNDVGSQYRSAIFTTTEAQHDLAVLTRDAYAPVLAERGYGPITTEIAPASDFTYFPAELHHQRYLEVHPNGYGCHAKTGIALPLPA